MRFVRNVATHRSLFTVGTRVCPLSCRGAAMPFGFFCTFGSSSVAHAPAPSTYLPNGCQVWWSHSLAKPCAYKKWFSLSPLLSAGKLVLGSDGAGDARACQSGDDHDLRLVVEAGAEEGIAGARVVSPAGAVVRRPRWGRHSRLH